MKRLWVSLALVAALLAPTSTAGAISTTSRCGFGRGARQGRRLEGARQAAAAVRAEEGERTPARPPTWSPRQGAPDANGLVALKNGKFVRYRLQGTEYLTAVLIDFSDVQHGQIAQPDRSVDNSTYWSADVSPQHYHDMLFSAGRRVLRPAVHARLLPGAVVRPLHVDGPGLELGPGRRDGRRLRRERAPDGRGRRRRQRRRLPRRRRALQALAASGNYGGLDLAQGRPCRPLRLRRRRRLRGAGRLHRPLRHRPRRRGRGGRRRRPGRRRHLEPPLVRELQHGRGPGGLQARRLPTCPAPTSGWATTRSCPRTAASACSRTSSATTSACPTSTTPAPAPTTASASGRS